MDKIDINNFGKSNNEYNYQMCILSVFGICFVILGHLNWGLSNYVFAQSGSIFGWFPYYSFHLPIFLFISGYFFEDFSDNKFCYSFGRFVLKKIKNLVIPYYVITGIYLLINSLLVYNGFTFVKPFSFYSWLINPWIRSYTITLTVPSWYLIALFIAEIMYVLIRKIISLIKNTDLFIDILILLTILILGIAAVFIKSKVIVPEPINVYLRSVVMMFFIQLGYFYKKYLEKIDKLPGLWYFLIIFGIQFIIIIVSGNADLSPGLYSLVNFGKSGYSYFLCGITGVALWLRISRIIASIPYRSKMLIFIGKNTKYIMAFHISGFFLLNFVLYLFNKNKIALNLVGEFSQKTFRTYLYYAFTDNPRYILLYFIFGLGFSLCIAKLIDISKKIIKKQLINHETL